MGAPGGIAADRLHGQTDLPQSKRHANAHAIMASHNQLKLKGIF
jgi:hypothetical protein